MTESRTFRGAVSALETVGGVAEATIPAGLCTTVVGCVFYGAMMVDGATHSASGLQDLYSVTFGDQSTYGTHNVLRNLAEVIAPGGGQVYDNTSMAIIPAFVVE